MVDSNSKTIRAAIATIILGSALLVAGLPVSVLLMDAWGPLGGLPMAGLMRAHAPTPLDVVEREMIGWMLASGALAATFGMLIARRLRARSDRETWAAVAIATGLLALFLMGAYGAGGLLLVLGGALALRGSQETARDRHEGASS